MVTNAQSLPQSERELNIDKRDTAYVDLSLYRRQTDIVACRPVATQRPRNKQLYNSLC
jgi:hypothetical protein